MSEANIPVPFLRDKKSHTPVPLHPSIGISNVSEGGAVARLLWEQEVEGSNPFAPTPRHFTGFISVVLNKETGRVFD